MNLSGVWGVLSLTFKESIRAKWLILFTIVFFLLAIDIPDLVELQGHILPANYLENFLTVLVGFSLPIIPLLALPMSSTSIVDEKESGTLQYILSNPISKTEFFLGRTAGLLISTSLAVIIGFGAAAVVSYTTNLSAYSGMGVLILFSVMLNISMLALGFIISDLSKRKVTALVVALFTWLLFTALSNVTNLAIILNLEFGELAAVSLVLIDPIELAIILTTILLGEPDTAWSSLGLIAYDYFQKNTVLALSAAFVAWIAIAFAIGFIIFKRQDLS
ncbi:MAG TPA: ABC transporter permease subunit [Nitrososphaerales archaeon]|nr:ABC transporter permease subunit [Nitrososphaerales archaeon]